MENLALYLFMICLLKTCEGKDGPIFTSINTSPENGGKGVPTPNLIAEKASHHFVTQTVYGFLDFTTTIGDTVMVFSPKSSAAPVVEKATSAPVVIKTSAVAVTTKSSNVKPVEIQPTKTVKESSVQPKPKIVTSVEEVKSSAGTNANIAPKFSSKVEVVTSFKQSTKIVTPNKKIDEKEQAILVGNNLAEPEYDFLSRQPSEFVEETFKVVNIKPSGHRSRHTGHPDSQKTQTHYAKDTHPTGLVTKLGGTVVKDGATTVHETSVIGTYISGKYAQVLQSSSHIYKNAVPRISSTPTLRILKTTAPLLANRHRHDTTTSRAEEPPARPVPRTTRRTTTASPFKNRFRSPVKEEEEKHETVTPSFVPLANKKPRRNKVKNRRNKNSSRTTVNKPALLTSSATSDSFTRRAFKPKIQPSAIDAQQSEQTSLYKFKLSRAPGRWQYKTSSKPRIAIRKSISSDDDSPGASSVATSSSEIIGNDIPSGNMIIRSDDNDLESSGSVSGAVLNNFETGNEKGDNKIDRKFPAETLNVEISTPAGFKDTYYEIATIKTPYTFQVGQVKNTRFITVTSTFEKTFEPEPTSTLGLNEPLTENILAHSTQADQEQNLLESSIVTLAPLYLTADGETPRLETKIETFSTTQEILKTHILPIILNDSNSTSITLIQTFQITRFVTATRTLPPEEAYQFVPSKRLKEFNSKLDEAGSELNIELDFGDNENGDESNIRRVLPDSDIEQIGSDLDLIDPQQRKEIPKQVKKIVKAPKEPEPPAQNLSPEQLQQLALLRFLNPGAVPQLPQFLQTSNPIIKLETLYESHVIPIVHGHTTTFSTISRPISTIRKTEYASALVPSAIPQMNPLFQQQQQQFHITTAPIITQTVVTQTQSKILKLTFGAKTAYTTLFSTNVIPTLLTTYITTSIQVQPTAAFPGFFPAQFGAYPFVG